MSELALRADDRVLVLDVLPIADLAALARILMRGSMVVAGTRNAIDEGRQQMSDFDNVLFIESEDGRIPWRNGYFTVLIVPAHLQPLLEAGDGAGWQRLLAPEGRILHWKFSV